MGIAIIDDSAVESEEYFVIYLDSTDSAGIRIDRTRYRVSVSIEDNESFDGNVTSYK